jgi:hypothetical protein
MGRRMEMFSNMLNCNNTDGYLIPFFNCFEIS